MRCSRLICSLFNINRSKSALILALERSLFTIDIVSQLEMIPKPNEQGAQMSRELKRVRAIHFLGEEPVSLPSEYQIPYIRIGRKCRVGYQTVDGRIETSDGGSRKQQDLLASQIQLSDLYEQVNRSSILLSLF
jgi:hypothetical protein